MADRKANARKTTSERRELEFVRETDVADGDAFSLYSTRKLDGSTLKTFFGMLDSRRAAARDAIRMVLRKADAKTSDETAALDDLRVRQDLRDDLAFSEVPTSSD